VNISSPYSSKRAKEKSDYFTPYIVLINNDFSFRGYRTRKKITAAGNTHKR
jgi:hypothetical protein